MDGKGNLIHSKDRFTAVLGVDNVIVINTGDVALVVDKDKVEDIKNLVHYLNNNSLNLVYILCYFWMVVPSGSYVVYANDILCP